MAGRRPTDPLVRESIERERPRLENRTPRYAIISTKSLTGEPLPQDAIVLRCRLAPQCRAEHNLLEVLQAVSAAIFTVDACTVLASPLLYRSLRVVPGKIAPEQDPPHNLVYTLFGLSVESPSAHLPIYREDISGVVSDLPTLVLDHACHSLASVYFYT